MHRVAHEELMTLASEIRHDRNNIVCVLFIRKFPPPKTSHWVFCQGIHLDFHFPVHNVGAGVPQFIHKATPELEEAAGFPYFPERPNNLRGDQCDLWPCLTVQRGLRKKGMKRMTAGGRAGCRSRVETKNIVCHSYLGSGLGSITCHQCDPGWIICPL